MLTQVQHDNVAFVLRFLRAIEAQQVGARTCAIRHYDCYEPW